MSVLVPSTPGSHSGEGALAHVVGSGSRVSVSVAGSASAHAAPKHPLQLQRKVAPAPRAPTYRLVVHRAHFTSLRRLDSPGRQVRVRRSAEDPEWIAQAVPRSPASADVPGVTARCSRPDFYPWNEYHEHILAVSPSYNLPCLQEEIPWPFHCRKVYIYIVDNFICGALKHSRQMKKWNEDSGSAGELCSVPEIFVANLSDFSSKSPSCGE